MQAGNDGRKTNNYVFIVSKTAARLSHTDGTFFSPEYNFEGLSDINIDNKWCFKRQNHSFTTGIEKLFSQQTAVYYSSVARTGGEKNNLKNAEC